MPNNKPNRISIFAICLSLSEVDLIGMFLASIPNTSQTCLLIKYTGQNEKELAVKLQKKYNFQFQVNASEFTIGKNQHLWLTNKQTSFVIHDSVNGNST